MLNNGFGLLRVSSIKYCFRTFKDCILVFKRKSHYDIAIAGGGLVGTAMACALAKNQKLSDKSIILIESSPKNTSQKISVNDEYSNRVVSLNPGTREFLESLEVWQHIAHVRYHTVKKLQVWDACSDALITFNDDLISDVSYIVENQIILDSLEKVCSEFKNVNIKFKSQIKNVELPVHQKPVVIEVDNGDKYTCELLIGADGAKSRTRQAMNCHHLSWNYHQKGVVATLKLSEAGGNVVAWQRFLPTGPVALLPLTDDMSSLVWSTGVEDAEKLLQLSDESFVDAVNDAFWKTYPKNDLVTSAMNTLNKILESATLNSGSVKQLPPSVSSVLPKSRAAFPLGFGHSSKYVAPGVVLIGDAAHRVHPLAGQGVNLGLKDVKSLTHKLACSVYEGNRLGSLKTLEEYQSQRQKQLVPMLATIDMLQKLYSTDFTPVVLLRSLGLQFTNAIAPVKQSDSSELSFCNLAGEMENRCKRRQIRPRDVRPSPPGLPSRGCPPHHHHPRQHHHHHHHHPPHHHYHQLSIMSGAGSLEPVGDINPYSSWKLIVQQASA